jgi:outer membrane cobalamin receptor
MYELSYGTSFDTTNLIRELYLNTNYQYNNFDFNIGARNTNHSVYGDFLTGNFNLGKKITDDMLIFGLISKTFRAPDATDLYGYSGNPNLEPEESISHEIGIKKITSFGDFSVSYFNNDIDNLIESDGSKMQNINKAEIRGVELDFSTRLSNGVDYNIKYTYQEPDDLTNDTLLSRRPRNKFVSILSKTFSDNDILKLTVTGQSRRDNSIYDGHRLGGFALFDINYLTSIADHQIGIKINNIFDKKYRLAHNYNTEGQSLYIIFRGNF